MKKKIIRINEDTLEITEIFEDSEEPETATDTTTKSEYDDFTEILHESLNCEPEDFYKKYKAFKQAEEEFNKVYDPFKEKLIKLHENHTELPNSLVIGGCKLTYVSPSTRTTIDSKKLKEEEPEIAKKFTKTTNVKASVRLEGI